MKYFKYDGPPGQLVGIGLVAPGLVFGVVANLAYLLAQNTDFTELTGKDAEAAEKKAVFVSPDGPDEPGTQDAPSEPGGKTPAKAVVDTSKTPADTAGATETKEA